MADSSSLIGQTISHYRIPKSSVAVWGWCTKPRTPNPSHMKLQKREKTPEPPDMAWAGAERTTSVSFIERAFRTSEISTPEVSIEQDAA
jgi:hypothetical protein